MRADYINSYYKATNNLFSMVLGSRVKRKGLKRCKLSDENEHIGILVDVDGSLEGCVFFTFSKESAIKMAEHIVGIEIGKLDDFTFQILVEIVKKINQLAQKSLVVKRRKCEMSEPQVITKDLNHIFERYEEFICIPMGSEVGSFEMHIVLKSKRTSLLSFGLFN